jgi:probable phosphoglycerate mutase
VAVDVLLVRHGQSTWNAEGRWQGQADPPLSRLGEEQARQAASSTEIARLDAVESSDLERARRTAAIIAGHRAASRCDARWRERHAGEWEGLTRHEIEAHWPGYLAERRRPAGWEDDDDVAARAFGALADLARRVEDGVALVVTHGGVIRAVERRLGAENLPVPNLGGVWLRHDADGPALGGRALLVDVSEVTIPGQL